MRGQFLSELLGFQYYKNEKTSLIFKLICISVVYFLLLNMNSLFIWNDFAKFLKIIISVVIVFETIYLYSHKLLTYNRRNSKFLLSSLLFSIVYIFYRETQLISYISIFIILAFLLLILWKERLLKIIYIYFFYLIIFYAIGSSIISILGALDLLKYIPHFDFPPQEILHENRGINYLVYGCFVTLNNAYSHIILPRACGFMCEPGHFSIILGLVYIIERMQKHKPNIPIIICGILTFSANFIIMALMVEMITMIKYRKLWRYFVYFILGVTVIFIGYNSLPNNLKQEVDYLLFDRNLSSVIDAFNNTKSLQAALDERINSGGEIAYQNFKNNGNLLFGEGETRKDIILSDYRVVLIRMGIFGLIIILLEIYFSTCYYRNPNRIVMICALLLVFVHRAWMLYPIYLYLIAFLGGAAININSNKKLI